MRMDANHSITVRRFLLLLLLLLLLQGSVPVLVFPSSQDWLGLAGAGRC